MAECKLSSIDISAIRYRKSRGEPVAVLAECFEVTERTIRRYCTDLPSAKARINVGEVIRLRHSGYTFAQIAQRIDADRTAIHRAIKRQQMGVA